MTEKEFIASIDDMKVVLSIEQYDYLVQCKSRYLALKQLVRNGNSKAALELIKDFIIGEGAEQEEAYT